MLTSLKLPRTASLPAVALGAVAALGLSLAAAPAQASTFQLTFEHPDNDCAGVFGTSPNCQYNSVDGDPKTSPGGYPNITNVVNNALDYGTLFQIGKVDFGDIEDGQACCETVVSVESNYFTIQNSPFTFTNPNGVQTWTYDPTGLNLDWVVFAFSVKGGNSFYLYEMTDVPLFSGFTQTAAGYCAPDTPTGRPCGVSHITFYGKELTPIPLPAAGWLLLTGLGGLALMRRRKQAA